MAESSKQKLPPGSWDEATWVGVCAGLGAAFGVIFGGGPGIGIGVACVGVALAAGRTHRGPKARR